MRPIVFLPLIAIGAVAATAAFAETRSFNETGFKGVSASAGTNVILKQGAYSISASGSQKDINRLRIEKDGDTLIVSRKNNTNWFSTSGKVTVTVTAPALTAVKASSGSDVEGSNLTFDSLSVSVSSGADVDLSGSCKSLSVSVSSGSDFDGKGLKCGSVTASASSGADATVFATTAITADASSGANISVHGHPQSVTRDTSSGADIDIL